VGPTTGVEPSLGNELHLQLPPQLTGCGKSWVTAGMIKRHGNDESTSVAGYPMVLGPQSLQEVAVPEI
jgi:hypothetical protein